MPTTRHSAPDAPTSIASHTGNEARHDADECLLVTRDLAAWPQHVERAGHRGGAAGVAGEFHDARLDQTTRGNGGTGTDGIRDRISDDEIRSALHELTA
jgi:hypothetical protein